MFFPGTSKMFVTGDSVFMLLKCMYNNISIEKSNKQTNKQKIQVHVNFLQKIDN